MGHDGGANRPLARQNEQTDELAVDARDERLGVQGSALVDRLRSVDKREEAVNVLGRLEKLRVLVPLLRLEGG